MLTPPAAAARCTVASPAAAPTTTLPLLLPVHTRTAHLAPTLPHPPRAPTWSCRSHSPPWSQMGQSSGWLMSRNSITPSRAFFTSGVSVLITMPGAAGIAHDATGLGLFSTWRRQVCDGARRRQGGVSCRGHRHGGRSCSAGGVCCSVRGRARPQHGAARRSFAAHPSAAGGRGSTSSRGAPPPGTCGSCLQSTAAHGSRTCGQQARGPRPRRLERRRRWPAHCHKLPARGPWATQGRGMPTGHPVSAWERGQRPAPWPQGPKPCPAAPRSASWAHRQAPSWEQAAHRGTSTPAAVQADSTLLPLGILTL